MRRFNYKRAPINLDKKNLENPGTMQSFRSKNDNFGDYLKFFKQKWPFSVQKRHFSNENALCKRIIISNDAILEWFQFFFMFIQEILNKIWNFFFHKN